MNSGSRSPAPSSPYAPKIISIADGSWVSACVTPGVVSIANRAIVTCINPTWFFYRYTKKSCSFTVRSETLGYIRWTEVSPSTITKRASHRSPGPSTRRISRPLSTSLPVRIECDWTSFRPSCHLEAPTPRSTRHGSASTTCPWSMPRPFTW